MKKQVLLLISVFAFIYSNGQVWTSKSNLPASNRLTPSSFVVNGKAYLVGGAALHTTNTTRLNDVFEYDPVSNNWASKTSLPGGGRSNAISFVFNDKGYVGLGYNGTSRYTDIMEYDPINDSWALLTNYPGNGGRNTFAVVHDSDLFVYGGGIGSTVYSDFWKYSMNSGIWSLIPNAPLGGRFSGVSFSIDSLIFFGLGYDGNNNRNDIWGYNVNSGLWSQYANFPGAGRVLSAVAVMGKKAIIGGGHQQGVGTPFNDYYEFDYINNSWSSINTFTAGSRSGATAFVIGNDFYLSCGFDVNNNTMNDLWQLRGLTTSIQQKEIAGVNIYPNPFVDVINIHNLNSSEYSIRIYDINGGLVFGTESMGLLHRVNLSKLETGVYYCEVFDNHSNKVQRRKILKLD